jgi:hypothetical protein
MDLEGFPERNYLGTEHLRNYEKVKIKVQVKFAL